MICTPTVSIPFQAPEDQAKELYYRFSPRLILSSPVATVKAWKRARFLDPAKLVPALVRYSQQQAALPRDRRDVPVRWHWVALCMHASHFAFVFILVGTTDLCPRWLCMNGVGWCLLVCFL